MVLQDHWVTPCSKPTLTEDERREMAEQADHDAEGGYDAKELLNHDDEYLADAYLYAMDMYVRSQTG